MLVQFLKRLHLLFYAGTVLFWFVIAYPILYFCIKFKKGRQKIVALHKVRRALAFLSTFLSGFWFRFDDLSLTDKIPTCVICCNHSSILDISALILAIKQPIVFIGKDSLLKLPVTGFFFRNLDIAVNRESKISSFRAYKKAMGYLNQGVNVVFFPEGYIDDTYPPILKPFKNGAFKLAIEARVPVLPISIPGIYKCCFDEGKRGSRPGISQVHILEPRETAGFNANCVGILKEMVFRDIAECIEMHEPVTFTHRTRPN